MSRIMLIDEDTIELALDALRNVTKDFVKDRAYIHNKAIEGLSAVFTKAPLSDAALKCIHGVVPGGFMCAAKQPDTDQVGIRLGPIGQNVTVVGKFVPLPSHIIKEQS